jgi:hypothetical protein
MAEPTPESVAELLTRLDAALRRADLLERRIGSWEKDLASVRTELSEFAEVLPRARVESDQWQQLEARLSRLEQRSLQALARRALETARPVSAQEGPRGPRAEVDDGDVCALVFARWEPLEAKAGAPVTLRVKSDGFQEGDVVEFHVRELGSDATPLVLSIRLERADPEEVTVSWTPPRPEAGLDRTFTYVARGRGREARSPVLRVLA